MELLKNLEGLSADEQMSAVVELQKAAMKHLEEQKQASIGKSAEMVIQGLKKIKSDFEAKFDSLNYDIQTKVASLKDGEQGLQGPKGEQGDRGLDGYQGKDGRDGKDGKDGTDGVDGVGVTDAKIDFDGSLVITLSDGREINVGEVVPVDVAEKIRTVHNIQIGSGGDSQTVLDAIAALQATIATYGTMATQNANNVAITGGTINNTTIGATTPSTGVFTTLTGGGGSANFFQTQGAATTKAVEVKALGSDTNIAMALRTSGTGAIDLAAGSSGVNISNGGTVTAITTTTNGNSYTSLPSIAISAPTTAGGVQATSSVSAMFTSTGTIVNGGTGYTVNDVITLVGGTVSGGGVVGRYTVTSVSGGVITAVTRTQGNYVVLPTNPVSVTGGTGTGATLNVIYTFQSASITNAGSGYVEQPTVTFSGGGGSGAAAYATVGGTTTVKSLGVSTLFSTAGGPAFSVYDTQRTTVDYWEAIGSTGTVGLRVAGSTTNNNGIVSSKGTGYVSFQTNSFGQEQLRVAHTASAVNYVQVTGSVTGQLTLIQTQGSDASVGMEHRLKGTPTGPGYRVTNNNGSNICFAVTASGANVANYMRADPAAAGSAAGMSSQGSDTNIDLTLTPKGTGNVRFGTYTASMALTIQGYVEIKDAGGTIRKLAVIA